MRAVFHEKRKRIREKGNNFDEGTKVQKRSSEKMYFKITFIRSYSFYKWVDTKY